jgi:hypothetical protein
MGGNGVRFIFQAKKMNLTFFFIRFLAIDNLYGAADQCDAASRLWVVRQCRPALVSNSVADNSLVTAPSTQ